MAEPLDATPVYRNLAFTSAFFGLTPLDLPLMLVPGGVVFLACMLAGVSTLWGFITSAAVGAGLVALKWRTPEDHLETLLHATFAPRRLSHKERDCMVLPFPSVKMSATSELRSIESTPRAKTQGGPIRSFQVERVGQSER